tara:strand:+ start:1417 stop:1578 length:162 start_codon:yes stop_codon:yes gene_type:complete
VLHADVPVEVVPVEWILVDHHNIMVVLHQIMVVVMEEVLLLHLRSLLILVNRE